MSIIPTIICNVSMVITDLKQRLGLVEQQLNIHQERQNLVEQKVLLEKTAKSLQEAASTIIPGSAIRAQVMSKCEEAEKELRGIEESYLRLGEEHPRDSGEVVSGLLTLQVKAWKL